MLGEAARSLSPELRDRYPDVPWLDMIATRNVAVHEYHHLDADILWTTATENLPPLDPQFAAIEEAERNRGARDPRS
ncbi:MAG: HepT-like ribonuclease domain-containing protein [Solirubrobacteraceae bacterium]